MPDRSREKTGDKTDRKRISSAVVVSRSFQRVQDKRGSPEQRRERRFRQRSPDDVRDADRRTHRLHMDRDENRQDRRKRISDRLGPRNRKEDEHAENDKEDIGDRLKQRARRGSPPSSSNQQRRNVFDRLDTGPPRGRGILPRDERMIEVEVNPQDVPRGKRYFMHDDRELPRRQRIDRLRARSRSPVWVHDKFEEYEGEEDQEANVELQNDNEEVGTQEKEIRQDPRGDRERHRQNRWQN